ncbi:MAG: hypothetical protein JXC33_00195 [Deltaproteobacteria bacterium]|nr:hypothetical protein [Deltaproteobacteria bacterium]
MKINRIMSIVAVAVSVFFISGYYSVCQAGLPTGIKKEIPKIKEVKTVQSKNPVKIISLTTGTATKGASKSGGPWTWTAVVVNTGSAVIKKGTLNFEATAVYASGEKCVVSSEILSGGIAPGTKATIKGRWSNCKARKLVLNITSLPLASRSPIDAKTTSVQQISAAIKNFTFIRDTKTWTAIIENTSGVPLSFHAEGSGKRGTSNECFARQDTAVIPPGGTVTLTGRYNLWQPGTAIEYLVQNKCKHCLSGDDAYLTLDRFEYTY